jgi:hypothetical protein
VWAVQLEKKKLSVERKRKCFAFSMDWADLFLGLEAFAKECEDG